MCADLSFNLTQIGLKVYRYDVSSGKNVSFKVRNEQQQQSLTQQQQQPGITQIE